MIYVFGDCILDEKRYVLRRADALIEVEPKVFAVLLYLLQHRDRVVPKEELLEQCWPDSFVSEAALTRCLAKVRQALGQDRTGPPIIQTVHRHGYRVVAAVETRPTGTTDPPLSLPPHLAVPALPASNPPDTDVPPAGTAVAPRDHAVALACAQCQALNRATRQFCAACGQALWRPCSHCGFRNEPPERFCGGCGRETAAPLPVTTGAWLGPPQAYTPAYMATQILASQPHRDGERKPVTVVVVGIGGG